MRPGAGVQPGQGRGEDGVAGVEAAAAGEQDGGLGPQLREGVLTGLRAGVPVEERHGGQAAEEGAAAGHRSTSAVRSMPGAGSPSAASSA